MRHRKLTRRLSRPVGARRAALRNLAINLFKYQRIKTTKTKAKCAQAFVDKLIGLGRQDTVHARRQAFKFIHDKAAVNLLFSHIAPLFKNKVSGFTRIIRCATRQGDGTEMVLWELTEKTPKVIVEKAAKEVKKREPAKPAARPDAKQRPFKEERSAAEKEIKPKKFLGGLRTLFKKERDSL